MNPALNKLQPYPFERLRALLAGAQANIVVLDEYLRLAGNKAAVAARLHISRPALYKKLAAIEAALGVDLDDGESRTSLHVALMVLDAQRLRRPIEISTEPAHAEIVDPYT